MIADLHCHTKLSDGSLGIEELIALAYGLGIKTLSITDHDTMAGTIRARNIAGRFNVNFISGVEISCTDTKRAASAHILGYCYDRPERLEKICHENTVKRRKAGQIMCIRAVEKFKIPAALIKKCGEGSTNLYKQHIMAALINCGYTSEMFGDMYHRLFVDTSDPDYIGVRVPYADPAEAIEAIHDAGGIAILAHPGEFDNFDLFDELIEAGIDGAEVWCPKNTEEQQELLLKKIKASKLIAVGGTDFHGSNTAHPIVPGTFGMDQEAVDEMTAYRMRLKRRQKKDSKQNQ